MTVNEIIGRLLSLAEHTTPAKLDTARTAMWRETCRQAAGKLAADAPAPEAQTREAVLDEIEKLIGAVEGRHFAAIATASREDDKRRHGTKAAFAMELRAAIRALKSESPMNGGGT